MIEHTVIIIGLYVGFPLNTTKGQELFIIDYVSVSLVPILGLVHSRHFINICLTKKMNLKNHPPPIPIACKLYPFSVLNLSLSTYQSVFLFREAAVMALKKLILELKTHTPALQPGPTTVSCEIWGKSLNLFAFACSCANAE